MWKMVRTGEEKREMKILRRGEAIAVSDMGRGRKV